MSPVTHLLVGWTVAHAAPLARRDRALVTLAGVAPDLDGLGILVDFATGRHPSVGAYAAYHHVVCHGLGAAAVAAALAFALARRRAVCTALVLLSFHLHVLGDLVGSAGPGRSPWSLAYLHPLSPRRFTWEGQWELYAWPNLLVTAVALGIAGAIALRRGRTPLELVSRDADRALVGALRRRLGGRRSRAPGGA